ncbi:cyclic pyranopterin monophosphate synthase MoaC [Nesterenkonia aerolata]
MHAAEDHGAGARHADDATDHEAQPYGRLTHVREDGSAHMVDVGAKEVTDRRAAAESILRTRPEVVAQILENGLSKGDALAVARIAGIMGAKRTAELVPLCHPLPISGISVDFEPVDFELYGSGSSAEPTGGSQPESAPDAVRVVAEVRTTGRTGVEMEALTAASVAALTLYDMIKALDRAAEITGTRVLAKSGGASGDWSRS